MSFSSSTRTPSKQNSLISISLLKRLLNVEYSWTNSISGKKGSSELGLSLLTLLTLWQFSPTASIATHSWDLIGKIPLLTHDSGLSILGLSTISPPEVSTFLTHIPSDPNNLIVCMPAVLVLIPVWVQCRLVFVV